MPRPPKKWPTYALENLENTQAVLLEIAETARLIQSAISHSHYMDALVLTGDLRVKALEGTQHLLRARSGQYAQVEDSHERQ